MSERYDVAVIGAGGLGLSVALHAALRGRSVVLLDQDELGSQTSPRAAGLACQVKNDRLQTELSRISNERLMAFAGWAGVELVAHQAGGIKVARGEQHAAAVRAEAEHGRGMGIDVELVDAREAAAVAPYFRFSERLAAITYTPSDLYLDPRELVDAYIEACGLAGVTPRPHSTVTALHCRAGEVQRVETAQDVVEVGAVVDTAGAWLSTVSRLAGFRLPIVPLRHQLLVTEPIAGVTNEQAAVRVVDHNLYLRPDRGGLMLGGYEPDPLRVDMEAAGPAFRIEQLELDDAPLRVLMEAVRDEVPGLAAAPRRELRGGIPTMTADGNYIIDSVPGVPNFLVVGGCNVAGLTTSPAIGELVAQLLDGEPPALDLSPVRLGRFDTRPFASLERDAIWRYAAREQWD